MRYRISFVKTLTQKALGSTVELDNQDEGYVKALISKFDIVDRDGDVVLPSAFTDGQPIKMAAWGHEWEKLAVGKGHIKVQPDGAYFEGNFFLNTTHGRDTYETVKGLGELQEWSWGFEIPKGGSYRGNFKGQPVRFIKAANAHEVCPVLVGANQGSKTVAIKSAGDENESMTLKDLIVELRTLVVDADAGDLPTLIKSVHLLESVESKKALKSASDEDDYAVIIEGFMKALDEAQVNLADYVELEKPQRSYADEAKDTIAAAKSFTERTESLADLRAKDNRQLSAESKALLTELLADVKELQTSIEKLAGDPPTEGGEPESQTVETDQVAESKRARTLAEAERRARLAS